MKKINTRESRGRSVNHGVVRASQGTLLTQPATHVQSRVALISKRKPHKMLKARKSRQPLSPGTQAYNSAEVARICSVSLRQLQWWDERHVVSPRQDGLRDRVLHADEHRRPPRRVAPPASHH